MAHAMVTVAAVLAVITTLTIGLRVYSRVRSHDGGADDMLAVAGAVPLYCMFVLNGYIGTIGGIEKNGDMLDEEEQFFFPRLLLPTLIAYATTMTLIRVSILFFYRRVFQAHRFRILAIGLALICVVWYIVQIFVCILQCYPVTGLWDSTIRASCIDLKAFWCGMESSGFLLNVLVLLLPTKLMWEMKWLATREKLTAATIFFVGGLTCCVSLGCMIAGSTIDTTNQTATIAPALILSSLTGTLALLAASLPTYHTLLPVPCSLSPAPSLSEFPHPNSPTLHSLTRRGSQATLTALGPNGNASGTGSRSGSVGTHGAGVASIWMNDGKGAADDAAELGACKSFFDHT